MSDTEKDVIEKAAPGVGIDLGTTYSAIGYFVNGTVELIKKQGKQTHASVVAFDEKGNQTIGNPALDLGARSLLPQNFVYAAKRMIGLTYDEVAKTEDLQGYSFEVKND